MGGYRNAMVIKTGIIGCGQGAYKWHIPNLELIDETELVAVTDIDESAMEDMEDADKYTNYENMIEQKDLDSIHITTPPSIRSDIVEYAAKEGISILIEKPTATSTKEVDQLIEIRDNHDIRICCTQNMRFMTIMQRSLDMVEKGVIGNVTAVDNVFSIPKDLSGQEQGQPWVLDFPGGSIGEGTPHLLYTAFAFTGRLKNPPGVTVRRLTTNDQFDGVSIVGVDEQDRLITARYLTQSHPKRRLTIHGSEGNIVIDFLKSEITIEGEDEDKTEKMSEGFSERWHRRILERLPVSYENVPKYGYSSGHYNLIKRYVKSIKNNKSVPVSLEEDRDVISVIDKYDELE
jgi:predicted dehydrogenase